ncbi:MAG: hypothetical protein QN131_02715 [Armatimonadota bacterium]|nr:hypothetical protein [Armatimonadota bacterium]MDR7548834.1 hypothetical protein [Armatimonadota bacterium]
MHGKLAHRALLALIPVGLLTTASLALSAMNQAPAPIPFIPPAEQAAEVTEPAPPPAPQARTVKPPVAQAERVVQPEQTVAQATEDPAMTEITKIAEEPLPELVVDKTPLTRALVELDRAVEQAKLAVTALDGGSQERYIQETINLLAGFGDASFRPLAPSASAESYKGVRPLLIEARVVREAAEVQWIASVQQQLEARSRKLAEIAQATGANGGTVAAPAPASAPVDLHAAVGPAGVLGTRGVRPEEQATEVVSQALRQAAEALKMVNGAATDQAAAAMEAVVRRLEVARKIVQIAIDR